MFSHRRLSGPYNHSKWRNLQIVYLFKNVCCRPQSCLTICRENYSPAGNQQQYPHLSPPLPTPTPSLNDICLKNFASTKMLKKSWYCMEKSRLCAVPSFFWSPLGKLKKYQSLLSPKSDVSTPLNSRKEAHRKIIILVDKALSKAGWQKFAWTRFLPTSAFRASVCSGFNGFNGFS